MSKDYFILSPGRCGSILCSELIMYGLNTLNHRDDYCQMQHLTNEHQSTNHVIESKVYHCQNLNFNHVEQENCDLLFILRRDMFASCLSAYLANQVFNVFTIDSTIHKDNKVLFETKLKSIIDTGVTVDLAKWREQVKHYYKYWVYDTSELKKFYNNVQTIYYEDFSKNNLHLLNNILGMPIDSINSKQLPTKLPYNKWALVNNKSEVINEFLKWSTISISDQYTT
jgi:hypothetical protein